MALHDIREVSVMVELDIPREIRFDMNAFAELEDKFGSMDAAFQAMQTGSMKAARTLLWAGLIHADQTLTEREVGRMVTLQNIHEVIARITTALTEAVPGTGNGDGEQEAADDDPT